MKQVSKDQFYSFVGPMDVVLDVHAEDKACLYKKRNTGEIMGKSVESANYVEAACGENKTYFIKAN